MEPQIRYARTNDGVSIACYALGTGRALLWTQFPFSHLQAELRDPDMVRAYEAIASVGTLVRYDPRGFGLSDRGITSFTLDELVADIEAVVERLEITSFVFLAGGASSPTALRYASMHPDCVSHLILFPGFARPDGAGWKQWEALASSAVDDWDYVSEALPRAAFGWDNDESLRRDAELIRAAVTPQTLVTYLADARRWDARDCVPKVRAPTLLLQQMDARYTSMDAARRLAAELPDGRIVMLTGTTTAERQAETFAAVAGFVGGRASAEAARRVQPGPMPMESQPAPTTAGTSSGTSIIMFTDIVDSTALTELMGDAAFRSASRSLDEATRASIRTAGGTPVDGKVLGDGVMGVFDSAARAIEAARACVLAASDTSLQLHIGVHAGDVLREDENVYGGAVNIASRICGLCEPGEILVSATVRDLARTSAGVTFEDRGEQMLKGIEDAVRVFSVTPTAQ